MTKINFITNLIIVLFLVLVISCQEKQEIPQEQLSSFDAKTLVELQISSNSSSYLVNSTILQLKTTGIAESYGHVWTPSPELPSLENEYTSYPYQLSSIDSLQTISSLITLPTNDKPYHIRPFVKTSSEIIYGPVTLIEPTDPISLKIAKILYDSLSNKDFGYSFTVAQNNTIITSQAGGFQSRAFEDQLEIPMTIDSRMQIASMTKTLTAAAFLQLAKKNSITPQTNISQFLPAYWKKGPLIASLTFEDLLTHRSGIRDSENSCRTTGGLLENWWGGLQNIVEQGVLEQNKTYCYQNTNFGLFRVLIPSLLGYQYKNPEIDETESARIYIDYIEKEIFGKSGVKSTHSLTNDPLQPTLGYSYPYSPTSNGFNPGSFLSTPSAYGFYLSALQAGSIYSSLFSPQSTLLDQSTQQLLLTKGYGSFSTTTPIGNFYYHDGIWSTGRGTSINPVKGFRSIWMKGPNNTTVVLFTNALRQGDKLFPLRSDYYYDITSFLLWVFYQANGLDDMKGKRPTPNFHDLLTHPEPH